MKRKVALLLSLVMILSMLPMHAFGRGITTLNIPTVGLNTFHLEFTMADLGVGRNIAPGALGGLIYNLVGNYTGAEQVTHLFPITLAGADLRAPGVGAGDGTVGSRNARMFVSRRGFNLPGVGAAPHLTQSFVTTSAHTITSNQLIPTGFNATLAPGTFLADGTTLVDISWNNTVSSASIGTTVPNTHPLYGAIETDTITVNGAPVNGARVRDNVWLRIGGGSNLNANSRFMPGSTLPFPTNTIDVFEFPAGQFPILGPSDNQRFNATQYLRLPLLTPAGGSTGLFVDVRFIPRFDPVAGTWSNNQGWLDVQGALGLTSVPNTGYILRVPFMVRVDAPDARITVNRFDAGFDFRTGAPLFVDQPLFGIDIPTLPGANINLAPVTPATFSASVIGLNTISIRETWTDRIRNISANEGNPIGMPNFPITQALSLRYSPLAVHGSVPVPGQTLFFRVIWSNNYDTSRTAGTAIGMTGIGNWYIQRHPTLPPERITSVVGFDAATAIQGVVIPSGAYVPALSAGNLIEPRVTQYTMEQAINFRSTVGGSPIPRMPTAVATANRNNAWNSALMGNAVGRAWWFQNDVDLTAAAGILVEAGPSMTGSVNVTPGIWEFPHGTNPFTGAADRARVEAGRPQFGVVDGGNLGWFTLRLVAQEFYTWAWAAESGFPAARFNQPLGNTAFRVWSPGTTTTDAGNFQLNRIGNGWNHGNNFTARFEDIGGQERHVLYVRINAGDPVVADFDAQNGVRNHTLQLGQLDLTNLRLFPTAQAPTSGDVTIDIHWGWSSRVGQPYLAYRHMATISSNVIVGTRGDAEITFGIAGDAPDLRSGFLGARVPGIAPLLHGQPETIVPAGPRQQNPGNNNVDHYRGVTTAQVRLVETVPGLLTTNWSSPIYFTFGEGVRILGAQVQAGTVSATNILNWSGWLDAEDMRFAASAGHVQVSPERVQINLPVNPIANINNPLTIAVTFSLSIEADFYEKYGTEAIEVTVSGNGVAALPEDQRTITVGYAIDPIAVTLDGDIVEIETDLLFGIPSTQLPDVRVTVLNQFADVLADNSEIWLYLVDEHGARTDLQLNPHLVSVAAEGNSGGLVLARPHELNHPHPSFQRHGVGVTVQRQPSGLSGDGSFDLVFSNLFVAGNLRPGMNYQIAVSGTRIAQNDQVVRTALHPGVGLGGTIPSLNAGTFTALPYTRLILTQGTGGIGDFVAAPGGIFGGRLVLREGMLPVDTNIDGYFSRVEDPFWLMPNPDQPELVVSMLNPRVFADFVGGDLDFSNGVVNFSGFDANGNLVEVELTTGSSNAVVNGQTVDIATFAGSSGPAGSIQTINRNDRTFVPLRFLTNAFLIEIGFDSGTVVLER